MWLVKDVLINLNKLFIINQKTSDAKIKIGSHTANSLTNFRENSVGKTMPGFRTKFQEYSGDGKEVFITDSITNFHVNLHK